MTLTFVEFFSSDGKVCKYGRVVTGYIAECPSVVLAMFYIDDRIGNFSKIKINNVERLVVSEELHFGGDYDVL